MLNEEHFATIGHTLHYRFVAINGDTVEREQKDIEIKSNTQERHLEVALTVDGIEYLQEILNDLKNSEAGRHWHIDDFEGWLGGDFKYLVIVRSE